MKNGCHSIGRSEKPKAMRLGGKIKTNGPPKPFVFIFVFNFPSYTFSLFIVPAS